MLAFRGKAAIEWREMVEWRNGRQFPVRVWLLGYFAALLLLVACAPEGELREETDERAFRRGKSLLREGRQDEALEAFLSVIAGRPDAAESHLEAGLLYLDHLEDPLAAIYHFRQYLSRRPDTEQAGFVRELIETAKKDFVGGLPGEPLGDRRSQAEALDQAKRLQVENERLKRRLAGIREEADQLRSQLEKAREEVARLQEAVTGQPAEVAPIVITPPEGSGTGGGSGEGAAAEPPETYTVRSGDTLSRISRTVYGTSGRWTDIFEANRDQLPSPNALRPGQVLQIPR